MCGDFEKSHFLPKNCRKTAKNGQKTLSQLHFFANFDFLKNRRQYVLDNILYMTHTKFGAIPISIPGGDRFFPNLSLKIAYF